MKRVILITIFTSLSILFIFMILNKNNNKKINTVNNKSIQEIEHFLLNINSYKADLDIIIKSNKNENKYKIKQEVKENYEKQIVEEPEEIANMEIVYENGTLKINNSNINASKVFNSYPYITDNSIFLTDFLKEYKKTDCREIKEEADKIIMIINNAEKTYNNKKELIVDKRTLKPESLIIKNKNNEIKTYILYNGIEINNI